MNIHSWISERLETIRFFYQTAAASFIENIRKIDAGEEPYDCPPDDYDVESGEPPFLAEWNLNTDSLTLLGHSGIAMLQVTLKIYLDRYKIEVDRLYSEKISWVPSNTKKQRGDNWFALYRDVFLNALGIDWAQFGVENIAILEQITLARDDIFHNSNAWGVAAYQSERHFAKYTESFFADEHFLAHYKRTGQMFPTGRTWAIDVSFDKMQKATELVDGFCQFMDGKWRSWE